MAEWFSTDDDEAIQRIVAAWDTAPEDQDEVLGMLIDIARQQVIAYADPFDVYLLDEDDEPTSELKVDVSARLPYAQLKQAENLWNAGRASGDGEIGDGSFSFTPRPLDKTIRGIIRPKSGVPVVL